MTFESQIHFPIYQQFVDAIEGLDLLISGSQLHGIICAYVCAGAIQEGEAYLHNLLMNDKKNTEEKRAAAKAIFNLYAITQQQIEDFDFSMQMLLPDEHETLLDRAKAFSEWCEGFTQGLDFAGIHYEQFEDEESKEALQHLMEFAELDYTTLDIDEDDEKALMEVTEYGRLAVLRIFGDLKMQQDGQPDESDTRH